MTTFDSALAAGGSATRHRLSADQRRRLADVPSALPLWLSPLQTMRTAAQEIAHELGVPVAFAGFRGGAWQVLGESREDSSTLSARIAHGPTFAQAADALSEAPAARWELEGREHTLVPLPVGPAPRGVLLVLEGDWTLSASELQDCAAALVDVPARPAAPSGRQRRVPGAPARQGRRRRRGVRGVGALCRRGSPLPIRQRRAARA